MGVLSCWRYWYFEGKFTRDTNQIDLLEIRQVTGATNELLGQFTYNSQHLPLTAVDAAGQTNLFDYNAHGQLTAMTNALGETVTMLYDTQGFLTNVTGSLPGSTVSFTYDATNRVRTVSACGQNQPGSCG